jgi:hypothetical protein
MSDIITKANGNPVLVLVFGAVLGSGATFTATKAEAPTKVYVWPADAVAVDALFLRHAPDGWLVRAMVTRRSVNPDGGIPSLTDHAAVALAAKDTAVLDDLGLAAFKDALVVIRPAVPTGYAIRVDGEPSFAWEGPSAGLDTLFAKVKAATQ